MALVGPVGVMGRSALVWHACYVSTERGDGFDGELATFGRNVRETRLERGLTQLGIAGATDLNQSYLSDLEHGNRNPTLTTLIRLARALEVRPSELLRDLE